MAALASLRMEEAAPTSVPSRCTLRPAASAAASAASAAPSAPPPASSSSTSAPAPARAPARAPAPSKRCVAWNVEEDGLPTPLPKACKLPFNITIVLPPLEKPPPPEEDEAPKEQREDMYVDQLLSESHLKVAHEDGKRSSFTLATTVNAFLAAHAVDDAVDKGVPLIFGSTIEFYPITARKNGGATVYEMKDVRNSMLTTVMNEGKAKAGSTMRFTKSFVGSTDEMEGFTVSIV